MLAEQNDTVKDILYILYLFNYVVVGWAALLISQTRVLIRYRQMLDIKENQIGKGTFLYLTSTLVFPYIV